MSFDGCAWAVLGGIYLRVKLLGHRVQKSSTRVDNAKIVFQSGENNPPRPLTGVQLSTSLLTQSLVTHRPALDVQPWRSSYVTTRCGFNFPCPGNERG